MTSDIADAPESLQERIMQRLSALNKTPRGASVEAGLGASTIRNIMEGRSSAPRIDTLKALGEVLDCDPMWLAEAKSQPEVRGLGTLLRSSRKALDLTADDVAEKLGVSKQAVYQWESGKTSPSTSNMMDACRFLEIDLVEVQRIQEKNLDDTGNAKAAARLIEARMAAGFGSAGDAARRFDWNETTYRSHENGGRGMKPKVARMYAAAFGIDPAVLLFGSEEQA